MSVTVVRLRRAVREAAGVAAWWAWLVWIGGAALPPTASYADTAPDAGYVGSQVCAGCHEEVSGNFRKTAMGSSMSAASTPSQVKLVDAPVTIKHPKLNRHYQVYREDSRIFQSEYELDSEGQEVFRTTHPLEFVVGSGAHGFGYVVRRENALFQAPLSYYTSTGKWDLSPGYELDDHGFNRRLRTSCLVCHAGRPRPVAGRIGLYEDPPFGELAIGCENCHGPGEQHLNARLESLEVAEPPDRTIFNPAKAPPRLGENVCMRCHQWGDARLLLPGKTHFDFRPGTDLADSLAILKIPPEPGSLKDSDLLEHNFAMTLSQCFRSSGGELSCFSCHEIHAQPDAASRVEYYRTKCSNCHDNDGCGVPLEERRGLSPANDCAGCHMPKRDVQEIRHTALTNHRIVARPDQAVPEAAYQGKTAGLPDLVLFNRPETMKEVHLPPQTLLLAYGELAAQHPQYQSRYLEVLEELAASDSEDPVVLTALGRKAKLESTPEANARALEYLSKAAAQGSTAATTYQDWADVLAREERFEETLEVLGKGLDLAPFDAKLSRFLLGALLKLQRYDEAETQLRTHVEKFPSDQEMRQLLEKVEAANRGQ